MRQVPARRYKLAKMKQHPAEVVQRAGLRKAVMERLVNRQGFLRIAARLADLPHLLVGKAQAAVDERELMKVLDHLRRRDCLFVTSDGSLPLLGRNKLVAEDSQQARLEKLGNRIQRSARGERALRDRDRRWFL